MEKIVNRAKKELVEDDNGLELERVLRNQVENLSVQDINIYIEKKKEKKEGKIDRLEIVIFNI